MQAAHCTIILKVGMYYADPVKLDASERTVEFSAELCQQRCQVVPECSHFTFWPDPGTGLIEEILTNAVRMHQMFQYLLSTYFLEHFAS